MENPYKVLGVAETASDEQIKAVYRELCKKYHPDLRPEGVSQEQAEKKMAEINAAYDQIMLARRGSASGGSAAYGSYSASQFADIRRLINQRRIPEAEELLDGVPSAMRNAEWHFLKATVLYSRGWFNDAYSYFATAHRMEPGNSEYAAAYNQMSARRNGTYNPGGYRTGDGSMGYPCDNMCCDFMLCNCLCNICDGDCNPCC